MPNEENMVAMIITRNRGPPAIRRPSRARVNPAAEPYALNDTRIE